MVALAANAGISGSDVVHGPCTLQVLQGQVRVRWHSERDLMALPCDLLELPDGAVWLDAITDAAVIVTGAPAD